MPKVKILVVEDERIVAKDIQNTLKNLDYDVPAIASTGEDAIEKAKELRPDIVLMDIVLKGEMDGIEAAKIIRNEFRIPIIYLTAYEDEDTLERAKITEPLGYILKPFEERDLHTTLEMALYKHMMETKLLDSESKYRSLVELSPDGITILSENKIVFANPAAVKILGYEKESDLLNKDILSFIPESHHEIEKEKIKYISEHKSILPFVEEQYHKKDKTAVHVESALLPFKKEGKIFVQLVFRDITERKRSEEELKKAYAELKKTQQALIQNEKLAALGRFSAGIAHEIRNPLANISASAQFCMTKYEIDTNMKRHFDVILRNTETANRIIKELLDFTSPRETILTSGDVKKVLNHVCEMAKIRCAKQNIEMEILISPDLPDIRLNEKKLEEAFMNFVSNAIESMPEGGKLTVLASLNDDDSIKITFKDTGCGIKNEDIDKIFEPFFTTKDDGTGLGLSLAYHIINSHSGHLSFESKIKNGTKIDIILPIVNIKIPENI